MGFGIIQLMMDREMQRLIAVIHDSVVITKEKGNVIARIKYRERPNRLGHEREDCNDGDE